MRHDLKIAMRTAFRNRTFTLAVIAVLGVGIGVNTAAFGLVRSLLLRPLPFDGADRLVHIWQTDLQRNASELRVPGVTFRDWQQSAHAFERLGVYYYPDVNDTIGDVAFNFRIARMSPEMFPLLGVNPAVGRYFTEQEARNGDAVAVLSWTFWRDHFGANAAVLGRTILV